MANKTQQTSGNVTVPEHARKALQAREVGNFLSNYAIIIIISIYGIFFRNKIIILF